MGQAILQAAPLFRAVPGDLAIPPCDRPRMFGFMTRVNLNHGEVTYDEG